MPPPEPLRLKNAQLVPLCKLKIKFPCAVLEIIHLQNWPKIVNFGPLMPKRGTHSLDNDLKILVTPAFLPINTKKFKLTPFFNLKMMPSKLKIFTSCSWDIRGAAFGCPWLYCNWEELSKDWFRLKDWL